jgi:iron uptake system EfeUOB component EfeO/EfeM
MRAHAQIGAHMKAEHHRRRLPAAMLPGTAALGVALLIAPGAGRPAPLDAGIETYRTHLAADIDRTLASVQALRASAAAGDVAAAKQAWIEARIGWERSEIFTGRFAPTLDRAIDAWPNGAAGFHAVEARLFGAGRTDFETEANDLVRNFTDLRARVRDTPLTLQGLFDGTVQLVYEVGESKVDGGESRVSGTSLNDMRNNVDGIDLAWRTIFASAVEARDPRLAGDVRRSIDGLKTMLTAHDLQHIDPDSLRAATEELVLKLQSAAPLLDLKKPALEADARP